MIRHIAIRKTADIVDMGWIDEGPDINHEGPSLRMVVSQVVGEGSAADTRADHDGIEIRIRAIVIPNQTGMRLAFLGNQIGLIVAKGHFDSVYCRHVSRYQQTSPGCVDPTATDLRNSPNCNDSLRRNFVAGVVERLASAQAVDVRVLNLQAARSS